MKLLKVYADKWTIEFAYKTVNCVLFSSDPTLYYSDRFAGQIEGQPQYLIQPYIKPINFK